MQRGERSEVWGGRLHPGAWCHAGGRSFFAPAYGSTLFVWSVDCRRHARTIDSHPQKRSQRRRGWASPFKIAEGAGSARPPTHAAAIRGRSGRRTQGRHDRRATEERWPERTRRPPPTPRREWPRGAIGVRGTSRQSRPSRPSDRPTNHQRASGGATRARCPFDPIRRSRKRHLISTGRAAAVDCRTAGLPSFGAAAGRRGYSPR